MHLTKEEERILDGAVGEINAKAMRILVKLGEIFDADKLIPIESTQIAGVSYKTIGDAGLEFLEDWTSAKVTVESRMNPSGMDLEEWETFGVPKDFAEKQIRIVKALTSMGVKQSCSCTPYQAGLVPRKGEHIAWSESSAVAFANSVLGAMTNREGGPSALSAAIIGKTANYGYHLEENRIGNLRFEVDFELSNFDFSLLGYFIGEISKNRIPVIEGIKTADWEALKMLSAGVAAGGGVSMFMIRDITPKYEIIDNPERFTVSREDLERVQSKLTNGNESNIISFGCPHCSLEEIKDILAKIETDKEIWISTTKEVKDQLKDLPDNVRILADTCIVVAPVKEMGIDCIATDSAKGAHYTQNLSKIKSILKSREELLRGD